MPSIASATIDFMICPQIFEHPPLILSLASKIYDPSLIVSSPKQAYENFELATRFGNMVFCSESLEVVFLAYNQC